MNKTEYNSKAELYHKYRWDYSPQAVDFILDKAHLNHSSTLLDVGAGTGILTKQFSGRVGQLYAAEPDSNMFSYLNENVEEITPLQRFSHSLPEIPDNSVDAIVVAHAIHWFDYESTIRELSRIAKEQCYLFSLENRNVTSNPIFSESGKIIDRYKSDSMLEKIDTEHFDLYFKNKKYETAQFLFKMETTLESFLGSMSSISFVPSPTDDTYQDFQNKAKEHFLSYAIRDENIITEVETIVKYGHLSRTIPA